LASIRAARAWASSPWEPLSTGTATAITGTPSTCTLPTLKLPADTAERSLVSGGVGWAAPLIRSVPRLLALRAKRGAGAGA